MHHVLLTYPKKVTNDDISFCFLGFSKYRLRAWHVRCYFPTWNASMAFPALFFLRPQKKQHSAQNASMVQSSPYTCDLLLHAADFHELGLPKDPTGQTNVLPPRRANDEISQCFLSVLKYRMQARHFRRYFQIYDASMAFPALLFLRPQKNRCT